MHAQSVIKLKINSCLIHIRNGESLKSIIYKLIGRIDYLWTINSKITQRLLHSLVHRSGIMIDIRNLLLFDKFDTNDNLINQRAQKIISVIKKMTYQIPLKMIGDINSDGSYPIWTQNLLNSRVVSIGVGNNIIFDKGMSAFGALVFLFDHTTEPKIPRRYRESIKYFPYGIRGKLPKDKCLTLAQIFRLCEIRNIDNTILKIDCEGMEWDVFTDNTDTQLSKIDQICVEFHNLNLICSKKTFDKYLNVFKKLETNFVITYITPNNFHPIIQLKNDVIWPFTIEVHLINKNILNKMSPSMITKGVPSNLSFNSRNWHLGVKENLSKWYEKY